MRASDIAAEITETSFGFHLYEKVRKAGLAPTLVGNACR
jgi:hypothetical protein